MPLYDLYCANCNYEQEIILKLDAEEPSCPECGEKMKKAVSATTFILKGSGWAKDGYSKNERNK